MEGVVVLDLCRAIRVVGKDLKQISLCLMEPNAGEQTVFEDEMRRLATLALKRGGLNEAIGNDDQAIRELVA
ncbi:hypothetical protein ACWAUC_17385 [Bradyrhizobium guangdongense]